MLKTFELAFYILQPVLLYIFWWEDSVSLVLKWLMKTIKRRLRKVPDSHPSKRWHLESPLENSLVCYLHCTGTALNGNIGWKTKNPQSHHQLHSTRKGKKNKYKTRRQMTFRPNVTLHSKPNMIRWNFQNIVSHYAIFIYMCSSMMNSPYERVKTNWITYRSVSWNY